MSSLIPTPPASLCSSPPPVESETQRKQKREKRGRSTVLAKKVEPVLAQVLIPSVAVGHNIPAKAVRMASVRQKIRAEELKRLLRNPTIEEIRQMRAALSEYDAGLAMVSDNANNTDNDMNLITMLQNSDSHNSDLPFLMHEAAELFNL